MSANQPVIVRAIEAAAVSPYPASFDGSTIRFQLALFAMLTLTTLSGMIAVWMSRELWKGRHDAYPWEPLFAVRVIFFLVSVQAFIRCGPEAAYMITYREGSVELLAQILMLKRWFDAMAIFPGLTWMVLVWVFYTPICSQMVMLSRMAPVAPRLPRARLLRMGGIVLFIFFISALIAVGKQ